MDDIVSDPTFGPELVTFLSQKVTTTKEALNASLAVRTTFSFTPAIEDDNYTTYRKMNSFVMRFGSSRKKGHQTL